MKHTTRGTRAAAFWIIAGLAGIAQAATVTRGPYLQLPTNGSMTVRWRTDVATDSRVAYGAAPGSLSLNADDPALTTEHVVTVSGLATDTKYFYSIGSVGGAFVGDDVNHFFRTLPTAGPSRPFRIFATGDGGFLNSPTNPTLSAHAILVRDAYYAFTAGTPTDLFMPLGDNGYVLAQDADYQRALFDGFHDLLRATPVLPIYGNHEQFSSNTLTQTGPFFDNFTMPTAGQAGGIASGSETYFSIDYANVHIVVLDSERARPADSPAMLAWLNADLAAANADWTIAMWHRPPYTRGLLHDSDTEAEEKWMRENVLPILENYGVDAVFGGHSHNYERSSLLDGHYGLASTFTAAFRKDSGDGNPIGDGPYRKPTVGAAGHEGAVYVVAGSSSEVRPATLNHPAHKVNLLQYGALVIDVDGLTLTCRFLDENGIVGDQFRIVKGASCPSSPAPSCNAGVTGKISVKNDPLNNAKDKFTWKWKNGNLTGAQLGNPASQTDYAVCIYDQSGKLLGGQVQRGIAWKITPSTYKYKDKLGTSAGIQSIKIKPNGIATKASLGVKGKGLNLQIAAFPATLPVTAQLINLDNNACWQSAFPIAKKSDGTQLKANIP